VILCVTGDDELAKERRVEQFFQDALGASAKDPLCRKKIYCTDFEQSERSVADAIIEAASSVSLFASQTAIAVLYGSLIRAEDGRRIAAWLETNPACDLLFCDLDKKASLYLLMKKKFKVENFAAPTIYKTAEWLERFVMGELNKRIAKNAAAYLVDALGNDLKGIQTEIEKILLYNPDLKEIDLKTCQLLVQPRRERLPYELSEPFGRKDIEAFSKDMRSILDEKDNAAFIPIVASLRSHLVKLVHANAALQRGGGDTEIAAATGMNPYVVKKTRVAEQVRTWSARSLYRALYALDEMSFGLKMGAYETRADFEMAVMGIISSR
jgi:DNA polymerase III delta subunit